MGCSDSKQNKQVRKPDLYDPYAAPPNYEKPRPSPAPQYDPSTSHHRHENVPPYPYDQAAYGKPAAYVMQPPSHKFAPEPYYPEPQLHPYHGVPEEGPPSPEDDLPDPIQLSAQGPTQAIGIYQDHVLQDKNQSSFRVVKELGKGGFGVVSLCERTGNEMQGGRQIPARFALKELISPKVFPIGKNENVHDYLPLNEAAIQRYLRHSSIVETYWADVRYLHPDTNQPLDIGISDVVDSWTPLDHLNDMEKTFTAAEKKRTSVPYKEVKLQMRIAMEHCDLGSIKDYLVDNPEKQGTRTLVQMLRIKKKLHVTMDPTRCSLLTALDIAEALKFMHKSKTLHGDLKPHNILLVSDPTGDEKGFRAKISDFGLSQHMTKDQSQVLVSKGTEAYLPVEVFQDFALTEKSDVYALGLLMWEIFYGIFWHAIYEKEKLRKQVKHAIHMGDYHPSCNGYCPAGFASIVHACVQKDASQRPTATEIVTQLNGVIAGLSTAAAQQPAPPDSRLQSRYNGASKR